MNRNIRKLTDGAMMIAIIGALLLIDRQLAGMLSGTFLFLFPLPMVFYSAKYGMKNSWVVLASIFILLFMLATPQTMFFIGCESFIGLVYGSGIYSHTDNRRILIRTIVLGALVELFAMVVFAAFFGIDLNMEVDEYKSMLEVLAPNSTQALSMINMDSFLKNMIVLSAALTGVLEGFITHMVSRMMLKRMRVPLPESTPIYAYFPPKWSGYVAVIGFIGYVVSLQYSFENELIQGFCQGLGMCGYLYLALFGAVAIALILPSYVPSLRKWSGVIAFVCMLFAAIFTAMIGFLYITTDYHKKWLEGGLKHASETKES